MSGIQWALWRWGQYPSLFSSAGKPWPGNNAAEPFGDLRCVQLDFFAGIGLSFNQGILSDVFISY
jgi:hypothetical protein